MTFADLINEIRKQTKQILSELGCDNVKYVVEPAKPGFGDVMCNVAFLLAGQLKKSPVDIAVMLSSKYKPGELVQEAVAHKSGYLNFTARYDLLGESVIRASFMDRYPCSFIDRGMKAIIEHTSVNPNKALHIGHVRNIVIGDCIARILRCAGCDTRVLNYVDDSGLQVADIVLGFEKKLVDEPSEETKFDRYCGDTVYVKMNTLYKNNPELEQERRNILKEIEGGSGDTADLAHKVTRRVLKDQLQTCWNLSVYYDCLNFESDILYSGLWDSVLEVLKDRHMVEYESEGDNAGCWVIRGRDGEDDKVLVRSNGTATYIAKDIPYAAWKLGLVDDPFEYIEYESKQPGNRTLWQTTLRQPPPEQTQSEQTTEKHDFRGGLVITVIDSRQSRLQNIIMSLMSRLGSDHDEYIHLSYESVTLSPRTAAALGIETGGKQVQMSGRKGLYVNADSVLELLEERVRQETCARMPDLDGAELDRIAKSVAVGTLRYEMIKQDLNKVIVFDLDRSLSLEGDTAPYIQYAYARASRILERSEIKPDHSVSYGMPDSEYERNLVRMIGMLGYRVSEAMENLSPKVIARYCHELAVAFNSFYEHVRVLDDDDATRTIARLRLVKSFQIMLKKALDLVGIEAPDRM